MERIKVYQVIDGERDYQDHKWGNGDVPDEEKDVAEWINYMEFHLQKAKNSVYYLDRDEALAEIRKVTALGVRAMEIHGVPARIVKLDVAPTKEGCACGDCECKK